MNLLHLKVFKHFPLGVIRKRPDLLFEKEDFLVLTFSGLVSKLFFV